MIDLRSDTVTRPTEAMLNAMRDATLGDDSRDGDETVRKLESLSAQRMGKQAATFMPSGTMTNLVAVLAHVNRGDEVLLDDRAHILNSELGGIAALAGAFHRPLPARRGAVDIDVLKATIRKPARNSMRTALICMETTHNAAGGAVLPLAHMQAVHALAQDHGIGVHVDGARVFNAAVALGVEVREVARHTDSVAFCVSKGLGAPVGSLLCGSEPFIERARALRRMVGGNMRQAGPLAAAGILAIETMTKRLAEDHATAKRLATLLHGIDESLVDPAHVETNLVRVDVSKSGMPAAEWSPRLKTRGVLVSPCAPNALRFVTHRHITEKDVDAAAEAFRGVWREPR